MFQISMSCLQFKDTFYPLIVSKCSTNRLNVGFSRPRHPPFQMETLKSPTLQVCIGRRVLVAGPCTDTHEVDLPAALRGLWSGFVIQVSFSLASSVRLLVCLSHLKNCLKPKQVKLSNTSQKKVKIKVESNEYKFVQQNFFLLSSPINHLTTPQFHLVSPPQTAATVKC